jgi:hypothetical protein
MKTSKMQFYSDYPNELTPDWGFNHLSPLWRATCADIVKNPDGSSEEEYGLVFKCKDGKIRTAWIMCDPEGNGAGHLDIVGGDDK